MMISSGWVTHVGWTIKVSRARRSSRVSLANSSVAVTSRLVVHASARVNAARMSVPAAVATDAAVDQSY